MTNFQLNIRRNILTI